MLCLTRKQNERIYIGDEIIINIAKIGDGTVCLGIDAPKNIAIER